MSTVILSQTMVLPEGLDPAQETLNYSHYALFVRWHNTKGWTVSTQFPEERLSAKGRKWCHYVEKRNRRFYYFDSYDEALAAARAEVNNRTVMGMTWAQRNPAPAPTSTEEA